jgi:hypothetical protein
LKQLTLRKRCNLAELFQLKKRIDELNNLAWEIDSTSRLLKDGVSVQPRFSEVVQKWYRGSRELLVQNQFSGLKEFEACYEYWVDGGGRPTRAHTDIEQYSLLGLVDAGVYAGAKAASHFELFLRVFTKARALIGSCIDEIASRELPIRTQFSFEVVSDEFQTADDILNASDSEPLIRAAGVVARVALERHLFTVIDVRKLPVIVTPPTKKKPEASDAIVTLIKNDVINAIQRSELEGLFTIANHCAHPRDVVTKTDVNRLIVRGRELASLIM